MIATELETLHCAQLSAVVGEPTLGAVAASASDVIQSGARESSRARRETNRAKRSVRILVVDDNPSVTALLSHALNRGSLQGLGADVHVSCWVAGGGRQALEQLGRTPFDAIITDVCLPEIDGKILISTIRRQRLYANLPIIAISGAGDVAERMALTAGANVYIDKPLRLRQIVEALRFLLHLHSDRGEGPQR